MARPTKYNEQMVDDVYKLKMIGLDDYDVGKFFGITRSTVHRYKTMYPFFRDAYEKGLCDSVKYKAEKEEHWNKVSKYQNERSKNDAFYRIRRAMYVSLSQRVTGKCNADFSKLDYTAQELIDHLKSLLQPGMTMENYGEWHIDHIKPVSLFDLTNEEQFQECYALSNLQPLWASDNSRKSNNYEEPEKQG